MEDDEDQVIDEIGSMLEEEEKEAKATAAAAAATAVATAAAAVTVTVTETAAATAQITAAKARAAAAAPAAPTVTLAMEDDEHQVVEEIAHDFRFDGDGKPFSHSMLGRRGKLGDRPHKKQRRALAPALGSQYASGRPTAFDLHHSELKAGDCSVCDNPTQYQPAQEAAIPFSTCYHFTCAECFVEWSERQVDSEVGVTCPYCKFVIFQPQDDDGIPSDDDESLPSPQSSPSPLSSPSSVHSADSDFDSIGGFDLFGGFDFSPMRLRLRSNG
jgi:hypothetical protein